MPYRKGVDNKVAARYSRKLADAYSCSMQFAIVPSWMQQLTNSYANDARLTELIK